MTSQLQAPHQSGSRSLVIAGQQLDITDAQLLKGSDGTRYFRAQGVGCCQQAGHLCILGHKQDCLSLGFQLSGLEQELSDRIPKRP
jgi:hypothetical protein